MISMFKLTDAVILIETLFLASIAQWTHEHSIRTSSADAANLLETVSCCIWATADMRHLFQISCDLFRLFLFFFLFFGSNFSEKKKHNFSCSIPRFQDSSSICNNDLFPLFHHLPSGRIFKILSFKTKEQLCSFCYCSLTVVWCICAFVSILFYFSSDLIIKRKTQMCCNSLIVGKYTETMSRNAPINLKVKVELGDISTVSLENSKRRKWIQQTQTQRGTHTVLKRQS